MDVLTILFWIVILIMSLSAVVLLRVDSDLGLMFAEKWGRAPSEVLNGQVVWITGASSGIGEYLAYELALSRCKLVLSARRADELERVKRECLARSSLIDTDILILPMDVMQVDKHQELFQQVLDQFGKVDILVNNAGRTQRAKFENIDVEVDRQMFELNVFSVIALTRVVIPHFLERNAGHVVVMSSAAGKIGVPGSASYSGSKHAIHGYMECLRAERGNVIKVTLLCPGPVFSNLLKAAFTSKPNEVYGQSWNAKDRRMETDRCARLCAVSIANDMDESWIAPFPFLAAMYAYQYCPSLTKRMMTWLGVRSMMKLRDGSVALSVTKLETTNPAEETTPAEKLLLPAE